MRYLIVATLFLAGCVAPTTYRMNNLALGMSKAEAIAVMGAPRSVAATDGVEILVYRLATTALDTDGSDTSDYFVKLVEGKVAAYGQRGDFDSTKDPTIVIKKEVTTKAHQPPSELER